MTASQMEIKKRTALSYYKALRNKSEGKRIDEKALIGRKTFLGIVENKEEWNHNDIENKYQSALQDWNKFTENAKEEEEKEKELLDVHPT